MMAETEVSKASEVAANEEKCERGMSSYQYSHKPDCSGISQHNQVNNLDDSYVLVIGSDDFNAAAIDNADVVARVSSVLPESNTLAHKQGSELDAWSAEDCESLNERENVNMDWTNENPPLANASNQEQESSFEDEDGVRFRFANSLRVHNWRTECWVEVTRKPPTPFDVKLESGFLNSSAVSSGEMTSDVTFTSKTEGLDSLDVKDDVKLNFVSERDDDEDMDNQMDGATGSSSTMFLQENKDAGNRQSKDISMASPDGSGAVAMDGGEMNIVAVTKPFNFLIRIPRFDDETLIEQIRLAKLHVDEKTTLRNAIQVKIQEKRASIQIHGVDYKYAKGEYGRAQKLVNSKRVEINSLLSVINKAKNALSIEEVNSRIYDMEHMIQHETLPLKEEKQLIREIKQLKQLCEQLSSNLGSQDEIKQALEQREEVEDRLKMLRKELHILKDTVLKAATVAMESSKKCDDENKKLKELQVLFRAATDVRQAAYAQLQSLRKELSKKNKHFFKYKDDAATARNYAFSRDREALHCLCMNQVKKYMKLWNTNDEFCEEYVGLNTRRTVQRLGTLDGHSLGPDEEQPFLPSYVHERDDKMVSGPVKVDSMPQIQNLELKQEATVKNVMADNRLTRQMSEHKHQKVPKPTECVLQHGLAMVSGRDVNEEVQDEVELTSQAEEIRRRETEAKLKEQHLLEELAKANEARERKKRQAEKVQMRAELRAQKEAEQKEKDREKRLRKKERKKAAVTDVNHTNSTCETTPSSESSSEITKDTSPGIPRKPQKPWLFAKHSKTKSSVPPPLRNRNKKTYRQWMWAGLVSLVVFIVFWFGDLGFIFRYKP